MPAEPGCPTDSADVVTAGLFNEAWNYLFGGDSSRDADLAAALKTATNTSAVLLAHSYGGVVAWDILFGEH